MTQYPLKRVQGYLALEIDGYDYLLDSGYPDGYSSQDSLVLDGQGHLLLPMERRPGFAPGILSEIMGIPVEGIIGVEVLMAYDMILDLRAGKLTLGQNLDLPGEPVAFRADRRGWQYYPTLQVPVDGRSLDLLWDTGAPMGYLRSSILPERMYDGHFCDFVGMLARWQHTEYWNLPVHLGGRQLCLPFARPPVDLDDMADSLGSLQGVISNRIHDHYRFSARKGWQEAFLEAYHQ